MITQGEKVGRMVEINHIDSWWDELEGEVIGESEYGMLSINIHSSDWRGGVWPFLPEEVRFINWNGDER